MLTDTHCHVLTTEYNKIKEILTTLNTYNIKRIIINGYNYKTNIEVLEIVNQYENVYGALGLHPDNIDNDINITINHIKENISHPKIIAVGEIGLDYYHNKENSSKQKEVFINLLDIAKQHNKPVIIHNREATDDMIKILKTYKLKGIIHCFTGSFETAKEYIKLGYKLGINGIVTFKNSKLPETLIKIDITNILLETDCPYLTPEPYRKETNEPKYLNATAKKVAEIYRLDEPQLAGILEDNLYDIFDFQG